MRNVNMDPVQEQWRLLSYICWIVTLIIDANDSLLASLTAADDEYMQETDNTVLERSDAPLVDMFNVMTTTVNNFRLCCPAGVLSDEVCFWVKPRSTTWFCKFLVNQYDNSRWLSMFRMTKSSVFTLADLLRPSIEKKNTGYRLVVPVVVRVAFTLFKLTHGANLTICSEMFAIGRSTCCKILREVVHAINDTLKDELVWPSLERSHDIQAKFGELCSLPGIVGAIDGMQISISKPDFGVADYYYFKSRGYSMNCQAVVDSEKRFLDIYVGMPGSVNDSCMLRKSSLFELATHENLMRSDVTYDGHIPYLVGDQGYPLLSWLMVPHRGCDNLSISETLFNQRMRKARVVVENAFGILKQSFRELLEKSALHVTFVPDVVLCCAILHNLLLRQSHEEVEDLLRLLHNEGLRCVPPDADLADGEDHEQDEGDVGVEHTRYACDDDRLAAARQKRGSLGVLLTTRRQPYRMF